MWSILLAGLGLWLLIEGMLYALGPSAMQRFGDWLARLPEETIRQAGLWSMGLGGVLLYTMVRLSG